MSLEDARDDASRADLWDAGADERQRLADEREQLADERERLADEREQLADEHERWLDHRYDELVRDGVIDEVLDEQIAQAEREGRIARAEARVERSILERDWARLALEREALERSRREADDERASRREMDADRAGTWEAERRDFVAAERENLADQRDKEQDERDAAADRRERQADERDQQQRAREDELAALTARRQGGARGTDLRSHQDSARVREHAERQRRAAARARERAKRGRTRARELSRKSPLAPEGDGPLLAAQFVNLSRELFASADFAQTVERVLLFALECLPAYVAAGVSLSDPLLSTRRFATDAVAAQLETLQSELDQGPSPEAFGASEPVHSVTFHHWPEFARQARDLGVADVLTYGLSVPRHDRWQPLGTLAFYAETPVELDEDTLQAGAMFAAYVAVAAGFEHDRHDLARREAALHRALGTRDVIGQAKGILMERQRIPAGQAFDILRNTSQRLNLRLHEVAARLAESGEMPG